MSVVEAGSQQTNQLLIPLHHDKLVSDLVYEVARRFGKYSGSTAGLSFKLRLWQLDGPVVDTEDLLKEVVVDPRNEVIFAIPNGQPSTITPGRSSDIDEKGGAASVQTVNGHLASSSLSSDASRHQQLPFISGQLPRLAHPGEPTFKIRIITPALAQANKDFKAIPLLQGGANITPNTTLWDLKVRIANSLGHVLDDGLRPASHQDCNCGLVKQLKKQLACKTSRGSFGSSTSTFTLVYGDCQVEAIPAEVPNRTSIESALRAKLGDKWAELNLATFHGGKQVE